MGPSDYKMPRCTVQLATIATGLVRQWRGKEVQSSNESAISLITCLCVSFTTFPCVYATVMSIKIYPPTLLIH